MKIALCAGHHDGAKGAVNKKHNVNEHDEALKVLPFMVELLKGEGHTVTVFFGKLSQKIRQINNFKFDMAIDLHFNAAPYKAKGCEVVYVPGSNTRKEQAAVMSKEMSLYMNVRDRGAKEGWYYGGEKPGTKPDAFVARTNCPAFIPEPLFIDNDKEVEYWFVAGRHKEIAKAVVNGIIAVGG